MKIKSLKHNAKNIGLAAVLAAGFALISGAEASAQTPPPPRPDAARPNQQPLPPPRPDARRPGQPPRRDAGMPRPEPMRGNAGDDVSRAAREQGTRDGQIRGASDRSRNKSFRPEDASGYERATNGYLKAYGSKDAYKNSYRQGFLLGYERAYNGGERGAENMDMRGNRPPPPAKRPAPRRNARPAAPPRDGQRPPPPVPNGQKPPKGKKPPAPRPGQTPPPVREGEKPPPPRR